MGFFTTDQTKKYAIIVGCGSLGANLANALAGKMKKTLIIDRDKAALRKLSPAYSGLVLIGDGTELAVLREAHIENATTVISATDDDNTNILIAQMAKEMFHTRHVLARLHDPEWECAYSALGIDTVIPRVLSPEEVEGLLNGFQPGKGAV